MEQYPCLRKYRVRWDVLTSRCPESHVSPSVAALPSRSREALSGSYTKFPLRSLHPSSIHHGLLFVTFRNSVTMWPSDPQVHHTADKVKSNERGPQYHTPSSRPAGFLCSWPEATVLLKHHKSQWSLTAFIINGTLGKISWYPTLYCLLFMSRNFSYKTKLPNHIRHSLKVETKFRNQFRITRWRLLVVERLASLFGSFS